MASKRCIVLAALLLTVATRQTFASNGWDIGDLNSEDDYNPIVLQTALRNAHAQRLADLEALERDMGHQIRSMQKRKYEITAEKRQHVACLVHVLSCYKKRR